MIPTALPRTTTHRDAADCPFSWVAYQQVVKLQYPFLQTITPFLSLELEWLQEVAGKFARLHLPDLQKHEVH